MLGYFKPFAILQRFTTQGLNSIREEESLILLEWIDGLTEIGVKAMHRTLPSLTKDAIDGLQEISHAYLGSAKSIAHHISDKKKWRLRQ